MASRADSPPGDAAATSAERRIEVAGKARSTSYERRLTRLAVFIAVPMTLLSVVLMVAIEAPLELWLFGWLPVAGITVVLVALLRARAAYPLRTLATLVEAVREGDYALRGVRTRTESAMDEVVGEINALSEQLRAMRLGQMEAGFLLEKIVAEIDVAVFIFDERGRLRLANRAAEALFAAPLPELVTRTAAELDLQRFLNYEDPVIQSWSFPARQGRWRFRCRTFRESGRPQRLLVVTDLSRALREEERLAWQRLIRVISHEMNNSLAPIKSMAEALAALLSREPRPDDWDQDAQEGLDVIRERADSLSQFMNAYAQLARLPAPRKQRTRLGALLGHVAALAVDHRVEVAGSEELEILADGAQLEQMFINLIKNAADATALAKSREPVWLRWERADPVVRIEVLDRGRGLPDSANLFTPFFTTKPGGSGIGLLLSRQIVEAHDGHLSLRNRDDGPGCLAVVELPIDG